MSNKWFKISEIKPEVNQFCLIYTPCEGCWFEYYDGVHFSEHHSDDVEYWMPIPELPPE